MLKCNHLLTHAWRSVILIKTLVDSVTFYTAQQTLILTQVLHNKMASFIPTRRRTICTEYQATHSHTYSLPTFFTFLPIDLITRVKCSNSAPTVGRYFGGKPPPSPGPSHGFSQYVSLHHTHNTQPVVTDWMIWAWLTLNTLALDQLLWSRQYTHTHTIIRRRNSAADCLGIRYKKPPPK